jgi:hypothetical protein
MSRTRKNIKQCHKNEKVPSPANIFSRRDVCVCVFVCMYMYVYIYILHIIYLSHFMIIYMCMYTHTHTHTDGLEDKDPFTI